MPRFLFNNTTGCKVRCKKIKKKPIKNCCKVSIENNGTDKIILSVSGKTYEFEHSGVDFTFTGNSNLKVGDFLFIFDTGSVYSIYKVISKTENSIFVIVYFYESDDGQQQKIDSCINFKNVVQDPQNYDLILKGNYDYLPVNQECIKKINLDLIYTIST